MNTQTKILLNVVNSTFINPFHAKFPHLYHVHIPPGIHTNFSQTDYYGKLKTNIRQMDELVIFWAGKIS